MSFDYEYICGLVSSEINSMRRDILDSEIGVCLDVNAKIVRRTGQRAVAEANAAMVRVPSCQYSARASAAVGSSMQIRQTFK